MSWVNRKTWLNPDDNRKLDAMANGFDKSRSEILRDALKFLNDWAQKKIESGTLEDAIAVLKQFPKLDKSADQYRLYTDSADTKMINQLSVTLELRKSDLFRTAILAYFSSNKKQDSANKKQDDGLEECRKIFDSLMH